MTPDHEIDPVDRHVGTRIRQRRRELRMSQARLGAALSITFQQIQKYEKGVNRVSCSALIVIAAKLNVPIAYFFDGLPQVDVDVTPSSRSGRSARLIATDYGSDFVDFIARVPPSLQLTAMRLARSGAAELLTAAQMELAPA